MFKKLPWPAAVPAPPVLAPGMIFSSIAAGPAAYPMAEQ